VRNQGLGLKLYKATGKREGISCGELGTIPSASKKREENLLGGGGKLAWKIIKKERLRFSTYCLLI